MNGRRLTSAAAAELDVHADEGATDRCRREECAAREEGVSVWRGAMSDANDTQIRRVTDSEKIVARGPSHDDVARTLLMLRDVQRPAVHRREPRAETVALETQ